MEEIRGAKKAKDKVAQVRQSGAVGRIQDDFLVFGPTRENCPLNPVSPTRRPNCIESIKCALWPWSTGITNSEYLLLQSQCPFSPTDTRVAKPAPK